MAVCERVTSTISFLVYLVLLGHVTDTGDREFSSGDIPELK
jgi:hypothetical protein